VGSKRNTHLMKGEKMGYEITLLVVETNKEDENKNPVGYCSVVATLDLCKCGYDGAVSKINEAKAKKGKEKERLEVIAEAVEKEHTNCYNHEGNYTPRLKKMTEKNRQKEIDKWIGACRTAEKEIPYVYYVNENTQSFFDSHGDLLRACTVKEIYDAIEADQKTTLENKEYGDSPHGYRRFEAALAMLQPFLNEKLWKVSVLLWGH